MNHRISSLLILFCSLSSALTGRSQSGELMRKKLAKMAQINSTSEMKFKPVQGVTRYVHPVQMTTAQLMNQQSVPQLFDLSDVVNVTCCGQTTYTVLSSSNAAFDYQDTGQYGPSADGCVGTTQFILGSKGRIRSFNKATMAMDGVLNISHDRFFSTISNGGFTADPNILFDAPTNRWFLFCDGNTNLLLAYSDGLNNGTITAETVWSFVTVDTVTSPGFEFSNNPFLLPAFFDYTTLGVDSNAVLLAADVLNNNPSYFSSAAYVITKSSIAAGGPLAITAFHNLVDQATFFGPASIQGVQNFDINSSSFFFSINALDLLEGFSPGRVLLNRVIYTAGVPPTLLPAEIVSVQPYVKGIPSPVLGTPSTHMVDGVTTLRPAATHIRNGILYSCTYIGVDNTGASTRETTVSRNGVRFWAINPLVQPAVELYEGTIFTASPANDPFFRHYLTPSIMTNPLGQILVGATTCGAFEHLNASITQIIPPSGTVPITIVPTCTFTASGFNYYAQEDWEFSPFARWGDHTRTSPDPTNNSFWTCQLFCSATNTWGAQTAQVTLAAAA